MPAALDGAVATDVALSGLKCIAVDSRGKVVFAGGDAAFLDFKTSNAWVLSITSAGQLQRVAGTGVSGFSGDGGPATNATFNLPRGIAVDLAGNVYIADSQNWRVRKVSPSGIMTTVAGNGQDSYSGDGGSATAASLDYPMGLAVDRSGNLYIAGSNILRPPGHLRKVTPSGTISTIPSPPTPIAAAVDAAGNIYVVNFGEVTTGDADQVFKIAPNGQTSRIAGNGSFGPPTGDGGPATSAAVNPQKIALDTQGNLYIADGVGRRIRKVTPAGVITTVAGNGNPVASGDEGPATMAGMSPNDVAVDSAGNLLILDGCSTDLSGADGNHPGACNNRVRKVTANGIITTLAGGGTQSGALGDGGPATSAHLQKPYQVWIDAANNLYIADSGNNRIRKEFPSGSISTIAGNGTPGFSGDRGPATGASLNAPWGVVVDPAGNVYISDTGNHRVRKVAPDGTISTVVGTGAAGFSGDGGTGASASLNTPLGLALDKDGNLYIADSGNGRIRKLTTAGVISTVAGAGPNGDPGDGGRATSAKLGRTFSIAVDSSGDLYIPEFDNNRLRKVTPDGTINTVSFIGLDSGQPFGQRYGRTTNSLIAPLGIALDPDGNIYISEQRAGQISKISGQFITTVAGNGERFRDHGDGGPSLSAEIPQPKYLAVDAAGNLFFSDDFNNRIRKMTPPLPLQLASASPLNAASLAAGPISPGEFVSLFGADLVPTASSATSTMLPTTLAGVGITVTDQTGAQANASLQYVGPGQVNLVVPPGLQTGLGAITVAVSGGETARLPTEIAAVAPGLFTATSSGKGVVAGYAVHVSADGAQRSELLFTCDQTGSCVPVPIDLGPETDKVILVVFGTGFRGRSSLSDITVQMGGQQTSVIYAEAQGTYPGLDQMNVLVPQSLRGAGEVDLVVAVGPRKANTVKVQFQ